MVNTIGMIDGILALAIVLISILIGLLNIIKAKAKLQKISGIIIICMGLVMLGNLIDFFALLFTESHLNEPEIYIILTYIWIAPILILGTSMGAEAILPDKKKLVIIISAILGLIFVILIFVVLYGLEGDPPFTASKNYVSGETLINFRFILDDPMGMLLVVLLIACLAVMLIINVIGSLQKAGESSGVIKTKFIMISLGWLLFIVFGVVDSIIDLGDLIMIPRLLILLSVLCLYLGTKPS
ncbi:MAG: hypothetical protein JXA99_06940 [Candidatus Lokiarchaeota archaeon]|nr:hypothetical protein [Candidatus Lokiarchaeota archaeon]